MPASFRYGAPVARVDRVRLAVAADDHLVRLFLVPLERALRAVDLDQQVVLAAVADLRGRDGAERAVLEADHGGAVVVELAGPARTIFRWQLDLLGQQARS